MIIGRTGSKPFLVLEDSLGTSDDLVTIKTRGKRRREISEQIRCNLASWMRNPRFESVRTSALDLAIVVRISPGRMKNQDIDNIAKVVIDALKKSEGDSRFLFYDDCQVVRLLVWKLQEEEYAGYNTDSITISFRIHDNRKQMVLVKPKTI
jgi:Holliday junction resolvase RusA-like endonuclease